MYGDEWIAFLCTKDGGQVLQFGTFEQLLAAADADQIADGYLQLEQPPSSVMQSTDYLTLVEGKQVYTIEMKTQNLLKSDYVDNVLDGQ